MKELYELRSLDQLAKEVAMTYGEAFETGSGEDQQDITSAYTNLPGGDSIDFSWTSPDQWNIEIAEGPAIPETEPDGSSKNKNRYGSDGSVSILRTEDGLFNITDTRDERRVRLKGRMIVRHVLENLIDNNFES